MKLTEVHPKRLHDREQRALAKMACIARCDVNFGGAKAMVLAKRLAAMGSNVDYDSVVSQAYTSSTGNAPDYLAYECPECGNAVLGQDAALQCCAYHDDDETADDETAADETAAENLDAMAQDDLQAYCQDESKPAQLREYAACKARAMASRLAGRIESALKWENSCENLYKMLPDNLRW